MEVSPHIQRRLGHLRSAVATPSSAAPTPPTHQTPAAAGGGLRVTGTGLIYRGSAADPTTMFAGFPSLVRFDDDHLGCAFAVAPSLTHGDSARNQSLAKHTVFARSRDGGSTWVVEGPIGGAGVHRPSDIRLSLSADGSALLGLGSFLHKRPDDAAPAGEFRAAGGGRAAMGYTDMENVFVRSATQGRTWEGPTVFTPPVRGPNWELSCPILDVGDRLLAARATYPSWNGDVLPEDERWATVAFVSQDRGASWPEAVPIFDGELEGTPCGDLIFWCAPDPATKLARRQS